MQSAIEVLDEVVQLFDQAISARESKAGHRMREALAERARSGEDQQALLDAILAIPGPYEDWIEACRQLAETAIAEGDLLDTVDAPELARFVISAFTGVQMVSNVLDQRVDLEQRIDQMWRFLLPGLLAPNRRSSSEKIRHARWGREQENVPVPASESASQGGPSPLG